MVRRVQRRGGVATWVVDICDLRTPGPILEVSHLRLRLMLCRSTLMAYAAVIRLCQMLGFSLLVYPFRYAVGSSNEITMLQAASASFMVLVVWSGCAICGIDMSLLAPFQSPVSVLGSIMLFFSMLIMSNSWCSRDRDLYIRRNILLLVLIAASICVGSMYGMANTGTTFLVLWVLEKYCEQHVERDWNLWLSMLFDSLTLYFTAMWLHAHPSFIASMFQSASV